MTDSLSAQYSNEELVEIFVKSGNKEKNLKFHVNVAGEKVKWFLKMIESFYPYEEQKRSGLMIAADPSIFKVDTALPSGKCAMARTVTISDQGQISEYISYGHTSATQALVIEILRDVSTKLREMPAC